MHGRHDQRAMGDVRIVARVLDDAGAGEAGVKLVGRERELGPQALRQRDRNRIGKLAGQKHFKGRARRAAGAGAGRPAAPEAGLLGLAHTPWPSAGRAIRLVARSGAMREGVIGRSPFMSDSPHYTPGSEVGA